MARLKDPVLPNLSDPAAHYWQRIDRFKQEQPSPGGVVLFGSSHMELFPHELLAPAPLINRGIAADRLKFQNRGVLNRMDICALDLDPSIVVFENGTNDLGELWRFSKPQMALIVELYAEVITKLTTGLPNAKLVLVTAFPTAGKYAEMTSLIPVYNEFVKQLAADRALPVVDIYPELRDELGELRTEFTEDGLHINGAGYELLAGRLRPHLGDLGVE